MKKNYLSPATAVQTIQYSGILMASGDPVIQGKLSGGTDSGDVTTAF